MLPEQKAKVKWNGAHREYYESRGYNFTNYNNEFEVNISDLKLKSNVYVLVECDYCGKTFNRKYANYNLRKEKHGQDDKDCCDECRPNKRAEKMYEKYGVKNPLQPMEFKEKIKQTNLERYGVEYATQSKQIKDKIKLNNIEKNKLKSNTKNKKPSKKVKPLTIKNKKKEFKDLTGLKFNHLKVISLVPNKTNKHNDRYWLCECDCTNKTIKAISENHLVRGNTKSCGCLLKEVMIKVNKNRSFRHLYPYYKEIYSTYDSMKKRCYNEKHDSYKRYGGRGIKICDEWLSDFMNFYHWGIENNYGIDLTIERINYDGNYEPSNCKWATLEEQHYNKSSTLYIEIDNEMKTVKQWAEETGISQSTIYRRYTRHRKKNRAELLTKEEFFKPVRKIKMSCTN